jgi:signal transduction histidine kinase/AmiR/NasT family two-component response regulator
MTSFSEKQPNPIPDNIESNVYNKCIRLIYDSTLSAVGAILTATSFLIYLLNEYIPATLLYGWAIYMCLVAVVRFFIYRIFCRIDEQKRGAVWGWLAIIMAGITGLGWGGSSILFFPLLTFDMKLVLMLVIVAYSAGALTTIFSVPIALYAIILPSVTPLIYLIYSEGNKISFSIGSMLLFFLGFVVAAAARLRRLLVVSLKLRFENEELVGYLKKEKEKSEKLNASLLLEIEERKKSAEKLEVARKEAEQANMAKTQFLANMSHDIRTPMNVIIGMTRLILDTRLTNEQQKFLENIKVSSDGLLGLLNDILDFSKIEAGQLLIANNDFNFWKMLENLQSILKHNATEKGLELNFPKNLDELPVYVYGDELRLRQILLNLIGNAIKFTHQGSVTIEVETENRANEDIFFHFVVHDTGIGIPEEKQKEIFAGFSQADSSITREFGGSGLGLTICKQLIEMMGGEIWIESEEGRGSSFHFSLTFTVGKESITEINGNIGIKKKLHILLADDNLLNRELAQLILENDKHSVITAENGLKALHCMAEGCFDLILMDVQMPTMDGLTASTIIRQSENDGDLSDYVLPEELEVMLRKNCTGKHIPIIAMTAHAMEGDRQKCLDSGMDNYITKPFDPVQIQMAIAECYS